MPTILVVGGGAIGGITAAQMPCNVVVLDANAEHVARLRNPGLVYEQEGVEHTVRLSAVTSIDELDGDFDFALIAVKSPQHREVLEPLVARGGIDTFVSLGNGLIQDRMEGIVGKGNLLACIIEWGGSNVAPGRLVRDSLGGYMIGELDGSDSERAGARALPRAGRSGTNHVQRARHDLVKAVDQQHFHGSLGGVRPALRRCR
jgi:2-dehydropantoate 2-reductase